MQKNIMREAAGYLERARRHRIWLKVVSALGCVVVFCTIYALILPAITMEKSDCGLTEHTHTEACYTQTNAVTRRKSVCSLESLNLHEHTEDCFDESGKPVCGYSDFVVHAHDDSCYDEDGQLWCPLPEIEVHIHDEDCFSTPEIEEVHTHTDECYTTEPGELICTESTEAHMHDEECYQETETLICDTPESDGHQHGDDCYDENGELICTIEESDGHQHGPECYETTSELVCALSEEPHQHTDECYAQDQVLTCELSTEPEEEAEPELICGKEEIILHEHEDTCFDENGSLICGKTQTLEHVHSDACFETAEDSGDTATLTCGLQEHTHTAECAAPAELTEEEQAQVEEVIALIDALSSREEIEKTLAALEDAGDEEDYDAYLTGIITQAKEAYEAYSALTEVQQEKVTNADKLMALEPLWSVQPLPEPDISNTDPVRLFEYAEKNEGKVTITVSDKNGNLEPDPVTGEYNVTAGELYNVRVAYSGDKLVKGRYYVTFASNIDLTQTGKLGCKDNQNEEIDAGTWYFEKKDDGTVWLIFDINENLEDHSDIILTADVTCKFNYVQDPVEFDGNIKVNIKHNEDSPSTDVSKWASGGVSNGKINWRTEIYGNSGSSIIGNTIKDEITTFDNHYYTDGDMEKGIQFEAIKYKPESSFTDENVEERHYWTVQPEDASLEWTESGWKYTMPEEITCTACGKTIMLGNDDWRYFLKYTSTVRENLGEGHIRHENKVSIDGDESTGRISTGAVVGNADIVKTGRYHHQGEGTEENPYANDTIDWTMTMTIPGAKENSKYDYGWHLWDEMEVKDGNGSAKWDNPLQNVTVTAVIGDKTYVVPEYGSKEAESSECPICWRNDYSQPYPSKEDPKIYPNQEIAFYCRCICTEATCANWKNESCGGTHSKSTYCDCWSIEGDTRITFQYSTPAGDLTTAYGGRSARLLNSVDLNNLQGSNGNFKSVKIDEDDDAVTIPGVFTKQLTHQADENNGYVAEYTITVNEGMADLSTMQDLTIEDTMTTTLGFLSGTLRIEREDVNGDIKVLEKGEDKDYTISYETNVEHGTEKKNKLTIKLNKSVLGAYKYTLIYDASVSGGTEGVTYKNDASVMLLGKTHTIDGGAVDVPQAVLSAQRYEATLHKYDEVNPGAGLNGAVFGLYAVTEEGRDDILIHKYATAEYTNDEGKKKDGIVQVSTLPQEGVVLHTHVLYYVQELTAPEGYQLDTTKHYFWFCNNTDGTTCSYSNDYGLEPYNATCVYSAQTNSEKYDLEISNKAIPSGHELPNTGGSGTTPYTVGGLLTISAGLPLLYKDKKRRKEDSASS